MLIIIHMWHGAEAKNVFNNLIKWESVISEKNPHRFPDDKSEDNPDDNPFDNPNDNLKDKPNDNSDEEPNGNPDENPCRGWVPKFFLTFASSSYRFFGTCNFFRKQNFGSNFW
jgi:hypothetical protein